MTWTKSAIREARKADLLHLLLARGYRLQPADNGNYRVLPDPDDPSAPAGLVVKRSFWIWSDRNLSGNTIDFFVHVEKKTFHDAMQIIQEGSDHDAAEQHLPARSRPCGRAGGRQEREMVPEILR